MTTPHRPTPFPIYYEPAPDLARPRHTEAVVDLLDAATHRLDLRYPPQPLQPEERAVRDVAAAVNELRAIVESQAGQIVALRQSLGLLAAVRTALTVPGAAPLTLFDYRYCRYAFGEEECERRMRFIHAFITGEDDMAHYDCYATHEPEVAAKVRGTGTASTTLQRAGFHAVDDDPDAEPSDAVQRAAFEIEDLGRE